MDAFWEAIPAVEFIGKVQQPGFMGNPRVKSSHLVGVGRFAQKSDDYIIGNHQMRLMHQRYHDDALKEVQRQGHSSGIAIVHYRKVDGVWKWAGLEPNIRFKEYEFDKIFYTED
jgi:scytalone dehydratase